MILQVAICDDETQVASELEAKLEKIFNKLNVKYEIDIYYTGEMLCSKMESSACYDLIFLDIEFAKSEISGVEVGKQIRDTFERQVVSIVYISWEERYSMQLFEIRPLNFLIKPLEYEKIEQVVQTHLKLLRNWADEFKYKIRNETRREKVKDIVYLESTRRQLNLYLADGRIEVFYGTLKEVFNEQLKKADFLHIHASYVVNYNFISALTRNCVVLSYKEITLPISKQKKNEVEEAYFAIMERRGVV